MCNILYCTLPLYCTIPNIYAYSSIVFIVSGSFIILFNRAFPDVVSNNTQFTILFPIGLGIIFIGLYFFVKFDLYRRRNRRTSLVDNSTSTYDSLV